MNSGILLSVAEDAGTHTKWRSAFRSLTEEGRQQAAAVV
jgi:hypothetical protein